nr:hypothetical protein [Spirochaetota bacterium]
YIHSYETVLKAFLVNSERPKDTFNFLLEQVDFIRTLINKIIRENSTVEERLINENLERLNGFGKKKETKGILPDEKFGFFEDKKEDNLKLKEKNYYRVIFKIKEKRFPNTWLPEGIIGDLKGLGKIINITANCDKTVTFEDMDISKNYFCWIVLLESDFVPSQIEDVFLFFKDNKENEIRIDIISKEDVTKIGEILVSEGKIEKDDLIKAMEEKKKNRRGFDR